MRIDAIILRELHIPLVRPFETSFGVTRKRRILLAEIQSEGLTGWGECTAGEHPFFSAESTDSAWQVLVHELGPMLAAEEPLQGGECQRISIFLSVFDVHVQNAPVTGRVAFFKHTPGQYLNAMRADCAQFNENVLIGIESVEPRGAKVGVRLIAGLIARRIVPFIAQNDAMLRGERISLIQFGSRVNVYLPKSAKIKVQLGDRVVGGLTVLAALE